MFKTPEHTGDPAIRLAKDVHIPARFHPYVPESNYKAGEILYCHSVTYPGQTNPFWEPATEWMFAMNSDPEIGFALRSDSIDALWLVPNPASRWVAENCPAPFEIFLFDVEEVTPAKPQPPKPQDDLWQFIDMPRLAPLIRERRKAQNLGMRGAADQIGGRFSPSTLSRIEGMRIRSGLDIRQFCRLCEWLDISPSEVMLPRQNDDG